MQAQNSLSAQLENINLSQENILKIGRAYLEAITSQKANVSVDITNSDGTASTILIPSNIFLNNEFKRLDASFKNVVGLTEDGKGRLIANDGTFREILLSSFLSTFRPNAEDMKMSTNINVSTNSIVENLISPLTEVEITLDKKFDSVSSAFITKIVTDNLEGIEQGVSMGEAKIILSQRLQTFEIVEFDKPFVSRKTRFYGDYVIESMTTVDGTLNMTVDSVRYSDVNNLFDDTRILTVGDQLTNSNGTVMLQISNVDEDAKLISAIIIAGVGTVSQNEKLYYKDISSENIAVRVPVRLNEKSIIFLSVVDKNTNIASAISAGNVFDSDKFIVEINGVASTFNEYFSSRVADIGRYLDAMVRENSIPAILGVQPESPSLNTSDFNVVQINQHLTNNPGTEKMMKIQKEKETTQNRINILTSSISDLNKKLAQGNYNSQAKLDADRNLFNKQIDEKQKLSTLLGTLVTDMTSSLNDNAESNITPKYRVRGFWPVQRPIANDLTNPQHIVQYEIRYRYVSANGNTANSESMIYTDGTNSINAQFSPWTFVKTTPLQRQVNSDGIAEWLSNTPADTDYHSINQLDVPINFGESVEFNIRAISEAGYPTSPIMSEWSSLIRVNFPEELLQESDISSMQRKNQEDQVRVRVNEEFANAGIIKHIATSFTEQETYFAHQLSNIASGKTTQEQKQISAYTWITSLENEVAYLRERVDRRYATATVQILDGNAQTHDVNNNSKIDLFAGNYNDIVDLSNVDNFGAIVERTFYLKILNRNQQTIEILSVSPGVLSQAVPNAKYSESPIFIAGSNQVTNQRKGQIFYLRKTNVEGTQDLYVNDTSTISTQVSNSDIDSTAPDSQKTVVNFNGSNASLVKLTNNANLSTYVTMTNNHPAYKDFVGSSDLQVLSTAFNRLRYFNDTYQMPYQTAINQNVIVNFSTDDKFLVGSNTCGASMFLSPNDISSFQVEGIDTSSAKEIYSGEEDSLLIPIKYQFRMTDAIGNPNGDTALSLSTNFTYQKTIGVDMLIGGKLFSFDVSISSRFRATSVTNNIVGQNISGTNLPTQPNIQ